MKKKYIIISVLAVLVIGFGVWYTFLRSKPVEYRYAEIKKGKITLKILATGTVQPENRLQIKSPISGRVDTILVKEGQKVGKGEIIAWISSTERAVMLDSARAQGPDEVKKWEDIYKPTPVIAPLGGTVIQRNIEPGQTFTTSDAIFVMADRLTVQAQVDETDLSQIKLNQRAEITMDAYLDRKIEAQVNQIAYEARVNNNVTTYTIYVLPSEKLDFLRSGMTANVTFYGDTREDILVVPNEYIKYENGRPTVQMKGAKKDENRDIKVGITDGKVTEILSGLEAGETVMLVIDKDTKSKNSLFSGPKSGKRGK
jgi:membrane fusion protein, macrolide-specific efflux system